MESIIPPHANAEDDYVLMQVPSKEQSDIL